MDQSPDDRIRARKEELRTQTILGIREVIGGLAVMSAKVAEDRMSYVEQVNYLDDVESALRKLRQLIATVDMYERSVRDAYRMLAEDAP
jgi:hypothetical protein